MLRHRDIDQTGRWTDGVDVVDGATLDLAQPDLGDYPALNGIREPRQILDHNTSLRFKSTKSRGASAVVTQYSQ